MHQDEIIVRHVNDLRSKHGLGALDAAEIRMKEEINKGDIKEAGIWLSVMYELTRAETAKN